MTMLGRRRRCREFGKEKRSLGYLMSTRGGTSLLRCGGCAFAFKTRLDLCVCRSNSLGASLKSGFKKGNSG
jgi:hypothetical protein